MAKKEKHTTESFLHIANRGMKMNSVLKKFGIEGGWTWHSLLELLCQKEHYYIVADPETLEDVASYCMVDSELVIKLLDYITSRWTDHFNKDLWVDYRVIRNDKLVSEHQANLYSSDPENKSKKRTGSIMTPDEIIAKHNLKKRNEIQLKEKESNSIEGKVIELNNHNITKVKENPVTETAGTNPEDTGRKSENASNFENAFDISELPREIKDFSKVNPKIKSYEDFKEYFNENQLREFGSKGEWHIVQATKHLFSDSDDDYNLQTLIAAQLCKEYGRISQGKTIGKSEPIKSTKTVGSGVYDALPFK